MKKDRLEYIDLISGLFMVQIIVLHIFQFADLTENKIFSTIMHVLFFFMPWFFFKSGYFYTSTNTSFKEYIITKSRKLLIPFIAFALIGFVIVLPFEFYFDDRPVWRIIASFPFSILNYGDGGAGNRPIWFLLSLLFTIAGYRILDTLNFKSIIILFPLLGFLLIYLNIELPLGLNNLFLSIVFFYTGSIYRKISENKSFKYITWCSVVLFLTTQLFYFSSLDFKTHKMIEGNYFIYLISSLAGIIIIIYLGKKVNYISLLNYIGKNSIVYFVVHWPIILLINNIIKLLSINVNGYFYVSILALVVFSFTPLLVKWIMNSKYKILIGY